MLPYYYFLYRIMMKNLLENLPRHQLTISQMHEMINKKSKHRNKDTLVLKKSQTKHFEVKQPYYVRQKFIKTNHTIHQFKTNQSHLSTPKKQNFLRKNHGTVFKQKMIKKISNLRKKNDLSEKKSDKSQRKYEYLKKGQCENICGFFKISCQNCKPQLDCFNVQFQKFLKENDLWVLNGIKQTNQNEESLKKYTITQIINFYQNQERKIKSQSHKKFYAAEEKAMKEIKIDVTKKMKNYKFRTDKEIKFLNWFQKIHQHFRKQFLRKKLFLNESKQRKSFDGHFSKQPIFSQIKTSKKVERITDFSVKLKGRQNHQEDSKTKSNRKKLNSSNKIKQKESQSDEQPPKNYLKIPSNKTNKSALRQKSMKKQSSRDIIKFKLDENFRESNRNSDQIIPEKSFINRNRTVKKNKTIFECQQEQDLQYPSDIEQIFKIRCKNRKRRIGILGKENISPEEIQLKKFKKNFVNDSMIIKKVEEYLKKSKLDNLKFRENDSLLTLTRKHRYIQNMKVQPHISSNFKKYLKLMKIKIDSKLKQTKKEQCQKAQTQSQQEQSLTILSDLENNKKLYFYDLFEPKDKNTIKESYSNSNYFKHMYSYKIQYDGHPEKNSDKNFIDLSQNKRKVTKQRKKQRDDILLQKGLDKTDVIDQKQRRKSTQS